jgi:septal ring factor EnvC (AmiA/AmiB activator)
MNRLIDRLVGLIGINAAAWLSVVLLLVFGALCGWHVNGWRTASRLSAVQAEFSAAREKWEEERQEAIGKALAESEAKRAHEKTFTERLALASKEASDANKRLSDLRSRHSELGARLRDARSGLAAALNRSERPPAAACVSASDAAGAAFAGCAEQYQDVARQLGECLGGMQMIEKTWDAARGMCR